MSTPQSAANLSAGGASAPRDGGAAARRVGRRRAWLIALAGLIAAVTSGVWLAAMLRSTGISTRVVNRSGGVVSDVELSYPGGTSRLGTLVAGESRRTLSMPAEQPSAGPAGRLYPSQKLELDVSYVQSGEVRRRFSSGADYQPGWWAERESCEVTIYIYEDYASFIYEFGNRFSMWSWIRYHLGF